MAFIYPKMLSYYIKKHTVSGIYYLCTFVIIYNMRRKQRTKEQHTDVIMTK